MEIDKLIEGADIVRFIKAQTNNQIAGAYSKNGPSKTSKETTRLETYGN